MSGVPRLPILIALLVMNAVPATAQLYDRRQGFWASVGAAYGSANITCDDCQDGPRVGSFSPSIRLGGTISEHVRLGIMADAWTHSSAGQSEWLGNFGGLVLYYPQERRGLFLEGGAGWSFYWGQVTPDDVSGMGSGFSIGIGYDHPIGHQLSVTPRFHYQYGNVGTINYSGGLGLFTTGWKQNMWSLGVALTYH
jgi:hypothetical protein